MAYIRKYPKHYADGSTCYEVRYRDLGNKQQTKRFRKSKDATTFKNKVESNRDAGTETPKARAQGTRFATVLDAWWENYAPTLAPATQANYECQMRNHVRPHFGSFAISNLTRDEVKKFVTKLQRSLSPASVAKVVLVLRLSFDYAVEHSLLSANPAAKVKRAAADNHEASFLTQAQTLTLADTIDPRYQTLILTAVRTGLRAGELSALTCADLNTNKGTISVTKSLANVKGHLVLGKPKTAAGIRTVVIGRDLAGQLKEHTKGRKPHQPVFTSPTGERHRHSNFYEHTFRPAVAACHAADPDFPQALRFHDLRHTAVALWIARGDQPLLISRRIGHTNVAFTLQRYGHLFTDDDTIAAERAAEEAAWAPAPSRHLHAV